MHGHVDPSDFDHAIPSAARRTPLAPPPMEVTEDLLRALPKADLHCHLDGSLRLKTILELAASRRSSCPPRTRPGSPGPSTWARSARASRTTWWPST